MAASSRRGAPSPGHAVPGAGVILQRDQLQPTPTATARTRRSPITPLPFLYCPSDPGTHIDDGTIGGTGYATTSYGTCDGDWYVWSVNWGPTNSVGPMNRSLFGPNYARTIAMVTDGTSNTLMASEG